MFLVDAIERGVVLMLGRSFEWMAKRIIHGKSTHYACWYIVAALENKVAITPGSNYDYPRPGVFRVTFALLPHALIEGLRRLESALGVHQRRWTPPAEADTLLPFGTQGLILPSPPTSTQDPEENRAEQAAFQLGNNVEGATPGRESGSHLAGRRGRTDGAADSGRIKFDFRDATKLSLDELTELRLAVSSCCC
ncbi:hypothetical protein V8E36_002085 [Tilletia maclaganii]